MAHMYCSKSAYTECKKHSKTNGFLDFLLWFGAVYSYSRLSAHRNFGVSVMQPEGDAA